MGYWAMGRVGGVPWEAGQGQRSLWMPQGINLQHKASIRCVLEMENEINSVSSGRAEQNTKLILKMFTEIHPHPCKPLLLFSLQFPGL